MKKLLAVAIAVAIAAPAISADAGKKFSVGMNVGYTSVGVADANELLAMVADMVKTLGGDPEITKMGGGITLGLEGTYAVMDKLGVGLRLGSVMPFVGKVEVKDAGKTTLSVSAMPVEFGARYMEPIDEKLSAGGALFLGYAAVSGEMKSEYTGQPTDKSTYDASGMVVEVMASGSYKVTPEVAVGLDLGYRILNNTLTYGEDDATMGAKEGDTVKDGDDKEMKLDLSGIIAAVSVSYLF